MHWSKRAKTFGIRSQLSLWPVYLPTFQVIFKHASVSCTFPCQILVRRLVGHVFCQRLWTVTERPQRLVTFQTFDQSDEAKVWTKTSYKVTTFDPQCSGHYFAGFEVPTSWNLKCGKLARWYQRVQQNCVFFGAVFPSFFYQVQTYKKYILQTN